MATKYAIFLLLSFALLASGLPYYGVKGPIRRYDVPAKEEVVPKADVGYGDVKAEDEPSTVYEDHKEPDIIPDHKEVIVEDAGADYVPDKDIDYVPDKDTDYVPDKEDYAPDQEDIYIDKDIDDKVDLHEVKEDYIPDQEDIDIDKDIEYVPGKDDLHEEKEHDYIPDQEDGDVDKDIVYVHEKEDSYDVSDSEYGPDKDDSYEGKELDHDDVPKKTWIQRLHEKWDKFEDKSREVARSFKHSVHSAFKNIHGSFDKLWGNFKHGLGNFGVMIHRGAHYVVKVVTTTVEEVKASHIINKLEKRLEQGNEIVDEFFQKVGEKMTHWMEKHNHKHVDEGLFMQGKEEDHKYPDIFQDPEIHQQVNKMVDNGILTQEEADLLSQSKHEFDMFEKEGEEKHVEKHDDKDLHDKEEKIDEHIEGSGTYDKGYGDQIVGDKVDHLDGNHGGSSYDYSGKSDLDGTITYEDQSQHHSIKKELEEKEDHVEDKKPVHTQIEQRDYSKKGGSNIYFPKQY